MKTLTWRTIFELFLIHLGVTEIANCFCFLSDVYASCRDIQLQHFHQWLMSCSATYWLSDSSFLSQAIVLHFSFHFSFVKTRTNAVKVMNNVGETWTEFSNLLKIREIRFVFLCACFHFPPLSVVGLMLSKHQFTH